MDEGFLTEPTTAVNVGILEARVNVPSHQK
jgi:hypothetical protein